MSVSTKTKLAAHRHRRESGFWLYFFPHKDEVFFVSDMGHTILKMLDDSGCLEMTRKSLLRSAASSGSERDTAQGVESFLSRLEYFNLLELNDLQSTRAESTAPGNQSFLDFAQGDPIIEELHKTKIAAGQCKTFGMPKRSCKGLPSGLISKGRKT